MKPLIKVWCLPADQSEQNLRKLHQAIVASMVGIPELELKGENDMVCVFPPDLMKYGLGDEIIIEVTRVIIKHEERRSSFRVCDEIEVKLENCIRRLYPDAKVVECTVDLYRPRKNTADFID